jgi:hypothetical protein
MNLAHIIENTHVGKPNNKFYVSEHSRAQSVTHYMRSEHNVGFYYVMNYDKECKLLDVDQDTFLELSIDENHRHFHVNDGGRRGDDYIPNEIEQSLFNKLHDAMVMMYSAHPNEFQEFCQTFEKIRPVLTPHMIDFYQSIQNSISGEYVIK